ncbi:TRAP transporter small permease [Vitreimonas sp.]|uniref:TRAP transporter small permease n=1 Tax=Vitreimonas sp. TaxID=3069702 RepID=UPI002ED98440
MAGSNALAGAFSALAKAAIAIAATSLCVLVLVLAWQVIGRYALNDSPGWTEPVALILMSVAALFGAAVAVRRESHFNFPTLVESAPAPLRVALKALARLIALGFGAALAFYGGYLMLDSWDIPMAGAPAPEGLAYIGVCLGGALIALFALERLIAGDPEKEH